MRKINKIVNIALIFTLIGVFLLQVSAYSFSFPEKALRVPSSFQQDKNAGEEIVRFVRPSPEKYPSFKLGIGTDKHHMARIVEELIHEKIALAQKNGETAVIRMPTGDTPLKDENDLKGVYGLLVERDDVDWSKVIVFMLDEYGGTSFDYHLYIYENFIKRLKELNKKLPKVYCLVDSESTWPIDKKEQYEKNIEDFRKKGVLSISPEEYSRIFDREIKKARPGGPYKAHVGFGGLGKARETGSGKFKGVHKAFNEEGSLPEERTRRIELSLRTIYSNRDDPGVQSQTGLSAREIEELGIEGIEKGMEEEWIPRAYANTTGMYELLEETETLISAANGKSKIPSVDVVVFGEISPDNPATYIRGHRDSYLVIDGNAASKRLGDIFLEQGWRYSKAQYRMAEILAVQYGWDFSPEKVEEGEYNHYHRVGPPALSEKGTRLKRLNRDI